MPTYRQVCYISAVLEMIGYLPDSRDHILRLLVEKLIKLDAHLSRDFIDDAYRESRESEEKKDVNNQVQALDLFMKLMFTFLDMECHDLVIREKCQNLTNSKKIVLLYCNIG